MLAGSRDNVSQRSDPATCELLLRELQDKNPDQSVGIIQANINMIKDNVTKWNDMPV